MPKPMHVRTKLVAPRRSYRRVEDDPVIQAARDSAKNAPFTKMVRDSKRDRISGQKGAASRMALRFVQKLKP